MSRYREVAVAEMDPAQRRVHDQIVAGKRGRFGGPFQILIRAPEICEHASKLGEHLRWGTSLPDACPSSRSSRRRGSGGRSTNGMRMRRWQNKPAFQRRRSR